MVSLIEGAGTRCRGNWDVGSSSELCCAEPGLWDVEWDTAGALPSPVAGIQSGLRTPPDPLSDPGNPAACLQLRASARTCEHLLANKIHESGRVRLGSTLS